MCDYIETTLTSRHIYSFNTLQHCLPCLTHVINLAVTNFMSVITHITHVETTTAIWEFDPSLPENKVLGNSLDVITVIQTLVIKIQASCQHIAYFKHLQKECGVAVPLKIPLHSNVHWGTAAKMLGQAYDLHRVCIILLTQHASLTRIQPINLFVHSAEQLFGPITLIQHPGNPIKHIPWTTFALDPADWECVNYMQSIISNANDIQHLFSSNNQPTLWHAIPAIDEFQTAWETKCDLDKYALYKVALKCGLNKIGKYYSKFDDKDVYVLALSKSTSHYHLYAIKLTPCMISTTSILQANIHGDGVGWC